jgi:putative isomerase
MTAIGPPLGPERHWNTWDSGHPVCLVHLPSRLAVRVAAYSAAESRYEPFASGAPVRLLEHEADARYVAAELALAGTRVRVELAKADPFAFAGRLEVLEAGEWALRFWMLLEVGFLAAPAPDPSEVRAGVRLDVPGGAAAYTAPLLARARWRSQRFCLVPEERPTYAGLYDDLAELRTELEAGGYYRPHPPQPEGRWAVLRFNGQSQAVTRFALAGATDDEAAERRGREVLAGAEALIDAGREAARRGSEPARAVRDVVAWNTVLDAANLRWFTVLSRNWSQAKFGGWGVWLDDVLYHGLLAARAGDAATAATNVETALTGQQPAGNLPCLLTAYTEWVDRSQPPIAAYVVHRLFLFTGDRPLLERAYPVLRRAHDWWFAQRDGNGNGVLEWGSSPTGDGTFVHTKQAAMDEAAMDNLPVFDDARFDERAHTLDLEEVGLNALVVLEGQMLARIAAELGRAREATALAKRAEALAARVRERLWDPEREVFASRFWSGAFSDRLSPTSFYPLTAGIATAEQAQALVRRHLTDPARFWGERPLPSTPYDDPATPDDVYWRGRVWPPLVFLTWEGLRRYGYDAEADELAERAWRMFAREWESRRHCHENFRIDAAAPAEVPDSDSFYTWGALMALMPLLGRADVSPWHGLTLRPDPSGDAVTSGGVAHRMRPDGAGAVVERDGAPLLALSRPVRVRGLEAGARIAFEPDDDGPEGLDVELVGVAPERVVAVERDGERLELRAGARGATFSLPSGGGGPVVAYLRPA